MKYDLIHGDCADVLPGEYRGKVDLILTSPPYDGLRTYSGRKFDFDRVADALVPCLAPGGVMVWIVGDQIVDGSYTTTSFRQCIGFKERGLRVHEYLIYQNAGGRVVSDERPLKDTQFMFVFSNGKPKTAKIPRDRKNIYAGGFKTCTGAGRTADDKKHSSYNKRKLIKEYGKRTQVWTYPTGLGQCSTSDSNKMVHDHPAIFPIKLAHDHIRTWTNEGDVVLDPMAGSGTTLSAAIGLKRKAVGIEIHDTYVALAHRRIALDNDGMLSL